MKIDRSLNLVLTLEREGSPSIHIHSMPLSRSTFEANYKLIGGTYAEMFARGPIYLLRVGPKVATLTLREVGAKEAEAYGLRGDGGVVALLAEIRRLSNVLAPSPSGWEMLPVDVALQRGVMEQDEWTEAESAIVFFMLVSAAMTRNVLATVLEKMAPIFDARSESRSATDLLAFLQTSKQPDHTHKHTPSSVPR